MRAKTVLGVNRHIYINYWANATSLFFQSNSCAASSCLLCNSRYGSDNIVNQNAMRQCHNTVQYKDSVKGGRLAQRERQGGGGESIDSDLFIYYLFTD